jgi:hypothetical protein
VTPHGPISTFSIGSRYNIVSESDRSARAKDGCVMLTIKLLFLLLIANGAPIIAKNSCGQYCSFPIDCQRQCRDGQRLLGPTKTLRGVFCSVIVTGAAARLLGLGWPIGLTIGFVAMLGDLFSSFIKRRLKITPSNKATGLDQVPESLFPLIACKFFIDLELIDIIAIVTLFFVIEIALSKVLFKLHIRDRPY